MNTPQSAATPRVRLRIGVTGHRVPPKLPEESQAPLRTELDRILGALFGAARSVENEYMAHMPARDAALARDFVIVSSLAEGSDRIVAEAGLEAGCKLEVVLPLSRAEYARDFGTEASHREFEQLLTRASDIVELDGAPSERPRAYEAAGLFMLANIDLLVAIWDGEIAAGIGGTAQIVERAIADGTLVVWIEPTHPYAIKLAQARADDAPAANARTTDSFRSAELGELAQVVKQILTRLLQSSTDSAPQGAAVAPGAAPAAFANSRDHHLFGPGPKRLLALDGGGVRGALTVAFLERMESLLSKHHGKEIRLGEYFDFVGGTSTGAIIAGALALGYRTGQVKDFYLRLAPFAFKGSRWRIPVIQAKFDATGLRSQIEEVVGKRVLKSDELITGFCLITKRMDTGSPWILANNPRAPYWKSSSPGMIGNEDYPLVNLVRASTAAPHFFDPELLPISHHEALLPDAVAKPLKVSWSRALYALLEKFGIRRRVEIDQNSYGLFVDGGVTPHNNPSLALFQMATLSPFNINWRTGPDHLTVMSVGTGTYRPRLSYQNLGFARFTKLALHALISLMTDAEVLVLGMMQWMGECPAPWPINSEIGTLATDMPPGGKMFRFLRYDVRLEKDWLARELDYAVTDERLAGLRGMDDPRLVNELYQIGCLAAEKQVKLEHLIS
jgi:uncharacterized protein